MSAARGGLFDREALQLIQRSDSASLAVVALDGDERASVCAHQSRLVRTDNVLAANQLERPQHGVIHERAALNDYLIAHGGGVAQLYDLEQRVLYDRVGQTCGDIRNCRAFLLSLLYAGVHEHGAAGAEVNRILCGKSQRCEICGRHTQRVREVLDERAAAA